MGFFPVNLESGGYRGHFQAVSFSSQGDLGVAEEHKTIEIRINHCVILWFGIKGNVVKCGRERRKEWCSVLKSVYVVKCSQVLRCSL